jgi:two-component system sensor histidine kinase KdpD
LTSISHDLRTPLASILGAATSLENYRNELGDSARDELVGTIREEAERLNRFIANLLDMTRVEAGAIVPRAEPVDLGEIIGSALERAKSLLSTHRVELDLEAPLPPLRLDPVLVEQVLFNLLDNAAKYAPPGSLVRVQARREDRAVSLRVIDEGPGIPPSDIDRIFDKFYRARAADRQRAGTGLGLAVCRGFVAAMGGMIVAANRHDRRGAVFTVTLPIAAAETSAHEAAA